MAKTKWFLVQDAYGFMHAKGEEIGDGLAVVHIYMNETTSVKNSWMVIDIKSGLHVGTRGQPSKKEALLHHEHRSSSAGWKSAVTKARQSGK